MRNDLFPILEELRSGGWTLTLLSNGTLINRDRATALADLGVKGVQVSIERPEDVHDVIRGRGSLASSLRCVGHLRARSPQPLNFQVPCKTLLETERACALWHPS